MFSYIVVHVDKMSREVCSKIRDCVYTGIKSACRVLKCQGVELEDAFMCAGGSCRSDRPHVALVCENKCKCSILNCQNGDLSEGQLMWLGKTAGATNQDHSTAGDVLVCLLDSL